MRPIWTGYISFGLVNIPVKLFSAIQQQAVGFKMVHKKDNAPIRYKKWCEKEDKEVAWDDIAKGVEISKGKLYILAEDEIEKLKPEKSSSIDIIEFVDANRIDPIFFDSHYFLAPDKEKDKAYYLFKEVIGLTSKVAVGRLVMRGKEYICLIQSYKNGMVMSTMNYAYEIRDISTIEELKSAPQLRQEEIALAKQLIDKLYKEEFDITRFKDTFFEQLKAAIKKKEKTGYVEVATAEKPQKRQNLMDALRASLKESRAKESRGRDAEGRKKAEA